MADDTLSGIGIGDRADKKEPDDVSISDFLDELEVTSISDLSDDEIIELANALDGQEELEGIVQRPEEGERGSGIMRRVARLRARLAREQVFQEQLSELETIANQAELLRRTSANLAAIDQKLEATNELLADLVESTARGASLTVKETNRIIISAADRPRDVTDDTDVTTSSVIIKANTQNEGSIFIGNQEVQVGEGFELGPGEVQTFPVDVVSENFKLAAEESGDSYSYVSLGL